MLIDANIDQVSLKDQDSVVELKVQKRTPSVLHLPSPLIRVIIYGVEELAQIIETFVIVGRYPPFVGVLFVPRREGTPLRCKAVALIMMILFHQQEIGERLFHAARILHRCGYTCES